jgi:GT2 family glycosyltransferase
VPYFRSGDNLPEVTVSIVIPCYNRWSFLPRVLDSIASQTFKNWEIILVDDASENTRFTPEQNGKVKYFRLEKRHGSGHARNIGVGQSTGEFILFVDDDTPLSSTYLEDVLQTYNKYEDAGAVGGRLIYVHEEKYFDSNPSIEAPVRIGRYSGEVLGGFDRKTLGTVEVPILHVISLIKREDFLSVGGFDETTYVGNRYREETDLFVRIRQAGKKLYFDPNALAYHFYIKIGGQRSSLLKTEYYVILNHKKFLKKFYPNRNSRMLICFVFRRFYDRTAQLFSKTNRILRYRNWREISESASNEV